MAGRTTPATITAPLSEAELRSLIDSATMEGILGASARFLRARNIEYTINGLLRFVDAITTEFITPNPGKSPLPESVLEPVLKMLAASQDVLRALNAAGEIENLTSTIRVIAGGETLLVLDRHAGDAVKIYTSPNESLSGGEDKKT